MWIFRPQQCATRWVLLFAALVSLQLATAENFGGCPKFPNPLEPVITCQYLIAGGGPGGIYSAYLLKSLGASVCVIEAEYEFGGRTRTYPLVDTDPTDMVPPREMSVGAQRINDNQLDMRCLATQANITLRLSPFDTTFVARGIRSVGTKDLRAAYPTLQATAAGGYTDLQRAIYDFALLEATNVSPVTNETVEPHPASSCGEYATVLQYMRDAVGSEAAEYILSTFSNGRATWLLPIDVCGYIEYFKTDIKRTGKNWYLDGGHEALNSGLINEAKAAGVRFFPGTQVECVYNKEGGGFMLLTTTGQYMEGSHLILALPPPAIQKLGGDLAEELQEAPELDSFAPLPVTVLNVFWPTRFWEKYINTPGGNFVMVSSEHCTVRSEFHGHAYDAASNTSRVLYTNEPKCVAMWRALYEMGGQQAIVDRVLKDIRNLFKDVEVPEPTYAQFKQWEEGWFHLQPFSKTLKNITLPSIQEWAKAPLPSKPLCLVSDAYDIVNTGWAQGALRTALNCVLHHFRDMADVEDDALLIQSGCYNSNTTITSDNEVPLAAIAG